jgi:hypothetical protein
VTTGVNNYALSILTETPYLRIANGGVQSAIASIATQLGTYRYQGTAVSAAKVLRDLIEDILHGQGGQVVETIYCQPLALSY